MQLKEVNFANVNDYLEVFRVYIYFSAPYAHTEMTDILQVYIPAYSNRLKTPLIPNLKSPFY